MGNPFSTPADKVVTGIATESTAFRHQIQPAYDAATRAAEAAARAADATTNAAGAAAQTFETLAEPAQRALASAEQASQAITVSATTLTGPAESAMKQMTSTAQAIQSAVPAFERVVAPAMIAVAVNTGSIAKLAYHHGKLAVAADSMALSLSGMEACTVTEAARKQIRAALQTPEGPIMNVAICRNSAAVAQARADDPVMGHRAFSNIEAACNFAICWHQARETTSYHGWKKMKAADLVPWTDAIIVFHIIDVTPALHCEDWVIPAGVGRFVLLGHTDSRGAPTTMLTTVSCGLDAQNQPMGSTCNIAWKPPPVTTEHVLNGTSTGGAAGIGAQVLTIKVTKMGLMRLLVGKCVVGIVGGTVLVAASTAALTGVATYAAAKYYYSVKLGKYSWSNQLPTVLAA